MTRTFTVDDVERMLDAGILNPDEKFELIRGEIVPMSPQQRRHSVMKMRVARWLMARVEPSLEVGVEMTVRLLNRALLEPDVMVSAPQAPAPGYVPIADVRLAIEIADTSLERDLAKANDYADAGLPELWIIDLNARETLVHRLADTGRYGPPVRVPFDAVLTAAFDPSLALTMSGLE